MAPELAVLPGDALAEILRRLPPHSVAAYRRVCRAWRDAVDSRLRGHLLSRSVRGVFINFARWFPLSDFLSRPSTGPAICGGLDFLPCAMGVKVTDHCNGLLLCRDWRTDDAPPREYVVNPATRRWARLPRRPRPHTPGFEQTAYLAFEPAASPHYEVFLIPHVPAAGELKDGESEWPPASYVTHVFSSATRRRWDKTTFVREGEAAGIVADMRTDHEHEQYRYRAVYWQSKLYIHCQHGYLIRMSLSDHKYRVIKLPDAKHPNHHLGRSLRGVYCAVSYSWTGFLQVWHLDESRGRAEWVLKHETRLELPEWVLNHGTIFEIPNHAQKLGGRWVLQDVNHRKLFYRGGTRAPVEGEYDWNSDEDDILDGEDTDGEGNNGDYYFFLGFHPYKETVFLISSCINARGMAYDWNSSKFQDLGNAGPADFDRVCGLPWGETDAAFPYTPCWIGEFPGNELESLHQDQELSRKKLELEEESDFTCMDEYQRRKFHGHAKRVKDSTSKIRRRRR